MNSLAKIFPVEINEYILFFCPIRTIANLLIADKKQDISDYLWEKLSKRDFKYFPEYVNNWKNLYIKFYRIEKFLQTRANCFTYSLPRQMFRGFVQSKSKELLKIIIDDLNDKKIIPKKGDIAIFLPAYLYFMFCGITWTHIANIPMLKYEMANEYNTDFFPIRYWSNSLGNKVYLSFPHWEYYYQLVRNSKIVEINNLKVIKTFFVKDDYAYFVIVIPESQEDLKYLNDDILQAIYCYSNYSICTFYDRYYEFYEGEDRTMVIEAKEIRSYEHLVNSK